MNFQTKEVVSRFVRLNGKFGAEFSNDILTKRGGASDQNVININKHKGNMVDISEYEKGSVIW